MVYSIYLDSALAELCLWNICILMITNLRFSKAISCLRLLIGSGVGTIWYLGAVFLPVPAPAKVMIGSLGAVLMIVPIFRIGDLRSFLKVLQVYLGSILLLGGFGYAIIKFLRPGEKGRMAMPLGVCLLTTLLRHLGIGGRREEYGMGRAVLVLPGENRELKCFLDTGNLLREPISGRPVCVISEAASGGLWKEEDPCRVIPYQSVGQKKGIMRGYLVPEIQLKLGGPGYVCRDVYVAVSPRELTKEGQKVDLLVSPGLLEDGR